MSVAFLDESGLHIGMARTHERDVVSDFIKAVPRNRGTVLTMIGAISLDGIEAMITNVGGTNAAVVRRFVHEHLIPRRRRRDE